VAGRKLTAPQPLIWRSGGFSRSNDAVIRVYDEAGNVIETHEPVGEFKEW